MKKMMLVAAALLLAGQAYSKTVRRAEPVETDSGRTEISTGMAGKWGVGFDTIPGASTGGSPMVPTFGSANALNLRYWRNDAWCLEGLLALAVSNSAVSESIFGVGVGAKYNFRKPVDDVLVQMLGRASFATDNAASVNISTIALWVGTGFEAFIPAWRAISVEGNVGLGFISQSRPGVNTTVFGINGNGFAPVSVAIHYYFGS